MILFMACWSPPQPTDTGWDECEPTEDFLDRPLDFEAELAGVEDNDDALVISNGSTSGGGGWGGGGGASWSLLEAMEEDLPGPSAWQIHNLVGEAEDQRSQLLAGGFFSSDAFRTVPEHRREILEQFPEYDLVDPEEYRTERVCLFWGDQEGSLAEGTLHKRCAEVVDAAGVVSVVADEGLRAWWCDEAWACGETGLMLLLDAEVVGDLPELKETSQQLGVLGHTTDWTDDAYFLGFGLLVGYINTIDAIAETPELTCTRHYTWSSEVDGEAVGVGEDADHDGFHFRHSWLGSYEE